MKKLIALLLTAILLVSAVPAFAKTAAEYDRCKYTLPTEGVVVLQNEEVRNITPTAEAMEPNPVIEGESPTTGYAYDTNQLYMPMLVQISNPEGKIKNGSKWIEKNVPAGIGIRAPWGGQYADIVYEAILYRYGVTRLTFVYSDSFEENEPVSVGPVRSARLGHVRLREEWGGGIVFAGGPKADDNNVLAYFKKLGATKKGVVFDLTGGNSKQKPFKYRSEKVAAPENYNVDVVGMRSLIPNATVASPRPFLFSDDINYIDGYPLAYSINLDWGHSSWVSHLYYDENNNNYIRYSGDYPYQTFASEPEIGNDETAEVMTFNNVIIQRMVYDYVAGNEIMPDMQNIGYGNADIFINGRYIAGFWVRPDMESPTTYFDDKGNEILLNRGKTYIAQMPIESLLTYSADLTMPK